VKQILGIVAVATLVAGTAWAQEQARSADAPDPASMNFTYTLLNTAPMKVAVSESANLSRFESLAGLEHIQVGTPAEGYAICQIAPAVPATYADFGTFTGATVGWGPPVCIAGACGGAGSSVTIRRITTDGRWQLDQQFARDKVERDVTVTMTLTNRTAVAQAGVQILRYADIDVSGTPSGDFWERTGVSVTATDSTRNAALTLSALTVPKYATFTAVSTSCCPAPTCTATAPLATFPAPGGIEANGDYSAWVYYNIGSIAPGKKVVVKYNYQAH
jgi:hypothetical protein